MKEGAAITGIYSGQMTGGVGIHDMTRAVVIS